MIPIRCLFQTRTFYSRCRSSNSKNILNSPITRILDYGKRFSSSDQNENKPPEDEKKDAKVKFLLAEMSFLREQGRKAPNPEIIKEWQWEELLKLSTKSARMNYYNYLFVNEKKKENQKIKKELKSQAYQEFKESDATEPKKGPKNTLFLRIYDKTMDFWRNNRLTQAMQFGDKLIFDCSYDKHMSTFERRATAKQLMLSFSENRKNKDPFDLHFCNADFSGDTMKQLERFIPNIRSKAFPLNIHETSYLDLFPKQQLVYLTPHCRDILTEYDPHSTYIIGAIVDKMGQQPLSSAKAKELGIKMAKLPLDKYMEWGSGSGKSLTLDQMMKIMLDLKTSRNWDFALRHVPRRKINNDFNENGRAYKWSAKVYKIKGLERTESNNSDNNFNSELEDQPAISTADKFKRKVVAQNNNFVRRSHSGESGKFKIFNKPIRTEKNEFDSDFNVHNKTSTAEKFKKNSRTSGKKTDITCTVFPKDSSNK